MSLKLVVDGETFDRAKSIRVGRDLRRYAGSFSATASTDKFGRLPIARDSAIKVLNSAGVAIFNGYVERFAVRQSADEHDITISGRDITADLIDSSLVEKQFVGPIEFEVLCRRVIEKQGLSIEVLNLATSLRRIEKNELVAGEIGQTAMDFLERFARRVQALVTTNDDGRLLIMRSDGAAPSGVTLIRQEGALNNIKASAVSFVSDHRYRDYVARGQVAPGGDGLTVDVKDLVDQVGKTVDPGVRAGRFLEFVAETPMDSDNLGQRARIEANVRRADSFEYSATIQGDAPSISINTTVDVVDDICNVNDTLLVQSITRSFASSGTLTNIRCTFKDAFSLSEKLDRIQEARSSAGKEFQ